MVVEDAPGRRQVSWLSGQGPNRRPSRLTGGRKVAVGSPITVAGAAAAGGRPHPAFPFDPLVRGTVVATNLPAASSANKRGARAIDRERPGSGRARGLGCPIATTRPEAHAPSPGAAVSLPPSRLRLHGAKRGTVIAPAHPDLLGQSDGCSNSRREHRCRLLAEGNRGRSVRVGHRLRPPRQHRLLDRRTRFHFRDSLSDASRRGAPYHRA